MKKQKNQSPIILNKPKGLLASVIFNLAQSQQQLEPRDITSTRTDYIPFGSNNLFPQEVITKYRRSSTHHAIIQSKLNYFLGDGLLFKKTDNEKTELEKYVEVINSDGESLMDVLQKVVLDWWILGNAYFQVVKSGKAITIFHIDGSTVRVAKKDKNEKTISDKSFTKGFWISNEWEKGSQAKRKFIPEWELGTTEKQSIYHLKNYSPNMFFYGMPDYLAALLWLDIEYRIPKYNIAEFKNGFNPSAIIDMVGTQLSDLEAKDLVDDIKDHFTNKNDDDENNSKLWINISDDKDVLTKVTPLSSDKKDGAFKELQGLAVQNIITSHRFTASLSGIATAGQLGSSQQIRNEFQLVYNNVIKPAQNKILSVLDLILSPLKFKEKLQISTSIPISFLGDIIVEKVLTINEQRQILGFETYEGGNKFIEQQQFQVAPMNKTQN